MAQFSRTTSWISELFAAQAVLFDDAVLDGLAFLSVWESLASLNDTPQLVVVLKLVTGGET